MKCIYCLLPSSDSKSVPHVLPEAIWPGGPSLPRGSICDDCNHFCGHKIEAALVQHPLIALALQINALPGKRGVARKQLGVFQRDVVEGAAVTFPVREPVAQYDENGMRSGMTFQIDMTAGYDMDRFRRALHHAALNAVALRNGVDEALDGRYDAVRRYVRRPKRGERWTFAQLHASLDRFRPLPSVVQHATGTNETELVSLEILSGTWMVDLLNSGALLSLRSDDKTTHMFPPDWRAPERPAADPTKHYRVSIF